MLLNCMAEIYVVRHGETSFNKKNIVTGHLDPPLTAGSLEEIKRLADKLSGIRFDVIFSSDLKRARQTAQILSETLSYPVKLKVSKELKEIDYGTLSGKPKEEVKQDYPRYKKDVHYIHPSGESFSQLYSRVVPFLKDIASQYQTVLVVTHAGCIRAIYSYCNNKDFQDIIDMKLGHSLILKCVIDSATKKAFIFKN